MTPATTTPPPPSDSLSPVRRGEGRGEGRSGEARSAQTTHPPLHGVNPHAVLAALRERASRQRANNSVPDQRKIALVIEGGGMRGVYSGGGAVALSHLGLAGAFDAVYATSAGVMNAAYFLSHQPLLGIRVYYEDLACRRFYSPLRPWKVLDVDYVFDHVVTVSKPLDVAAVLSSPSRFAVAVMDRRTGDALMIDTRATRAPLLQVLKAATAIPVFYNRAIDIDGRPCTDGGLLIPFPIQQALADGCTDVLVLLTRSRDYLSPAPPRWSQWVFNCFSPRAHPNFRRAYARRDHHENTARATALGNASCPADVNIATMCTDPADDRIVGTMTTDAAKLHAAAVRYGRQVLRAFDSPDAETWTLPEPVPV